MSIRLPALLLFPCLLSAQTDAPAEPAITSKRIPGFSLLPAGSVLTDVMVPRYDDARKLTSVLKAESITVIDETRLQADRVAIRLFNPEGGQSGRADLTTALFDHGRGILRAHEPVKIVTDRFTAEGTGLVYVFDQAEGFLTGPVTTIIENPPSTAMISTPRLPKSGISALFGASMVALAAAQPPLVTAEEKAVMEADAAPRADKLAEANRETRGALRADLAASAAANKAVENFLIQAELLDEAAADAPAPEPKPLEIEPDPNRTNIHSDRGLYFSAGALVYVGNVRVDDPRFTLSGGNELKVFFENEPAEGDKPAGGLARMGTPRRIVATGAILLKRIGADGEPPIEASGSLFSYDVKTKVAILTGGAPWITHGENFFRSERADGTLKVDLNTGDYSFDGASTTGVHNETKQR